jgi:hypothetical protein
MNYQVKRKGRNYLREGSVEIAWGGGKPIEIVIDNVRVE